MSDRQKQTGGDHSTNIQAQSVTVGPSYAEVREMALDVFQANFLRLAQVAEQVARDRAEHITERFLEHLQKEYPEGMARAEDPGMLRDIYEAQKEYACSGDEDLEDILVTLLVERAKDADPTTRSVSVSDAIRVSGGLTKTHMDVLTLLWIIHQVSNNSLTSLDSLHQWVSDHIVPFAAVLPRPDPDYTLLVAKGTAILRTGKVDLGKTLINRWPGLFSRGIAREDIPEDLLDFADDVRVFTPCLRDPERLQVCALTEDVARNKLVETFGVPMTIVELLKSSTMKPRDAVDAVCEAVPEFEAVAEEWEGTLGAVYPTAVGVAIGHAHWVTTTGADADLGIWLGES